MATCSGAGPSVALEGGVLLILGRVRVTKDNPFPAVHGRVCYHPCETVCNRAELDGAVSIHAVERFLGGN
ncbi:MAG: hypothetical protein ABR500_06695 [Dermatophilaceae bacterium]